MSESRTRFYLDKRNGKIMGVCAGIADYFCLLFVLTGIQNVVLKVLFFKHLAEEFGFFDRGGADKNRLPFAVGSFDLVNDCLVFLCYNRNPITQ